MQRLHLGLELQCGTAGVGEGRRVGVRGGSVQSLHVGVEKSYNAVQWDRGCRRGPHIPYIGFGEGREDVGGNPYTLYRALTRPST